MSHRIRLFLFLSFFAIASGVSAQPPGPGGGGGRPCTTPPCKGGNGGGNGNCPTCIPIDQGVVFLLIGGLIIGAKKYTSYKANAET